MCTKKGARATRRIPTSDPRGDGSAPAGQHEGGLPQRGELRLEGARLQQACVEGLDGRAAWLAAARHRRLEPRLSQVILSAVRGEGRALLRPV